MKKTTHVHCQQCGKPMNAKGYLLECDYCLSKKNED